MQLTYTFYHTYVCSISRLCNT